MSTQTPQGISCGNCHGKHASVAEVRQCHFPPAPPPPPAQPTVEWATQRQKDYIRDLGGDPVHAEKLTKVGASLYITRLKKEARTRQVATPPPAPQQLAPQSWSSTPQNQTTKIPLDMLYKLEDGYYATRMDSNQGYTFFRISRPKSGQFKNAFKVQTQHGPDLKLALVIYDPGTRDRIYWHRKSIEDNLLLAVVDPNGSGIAYAEKLGKCMRCNTELTDERSRWYGIGPECEKKWPHIIDLVNDRKGEFAYGRES